MLTDDEIRDRVEAYRRNGNNGHATARELAMEHSALRYTLKIAASRGLLLDHPPAMPGYRISQLTEGPHGRSIQQKPEHGEPFEKPAGHVISGVSTLVDADGNRVVEWIKTKQDAVAQQAAMQAAIAAFCSELPRAEPIAGPGLCNDDLLNQYTVTDLHFGKLSWGEETGTDYDLKIAEQLVMDWFAAAIRMSPEASTAVFAQLGDLLHHDSHLSVTPTHAHVLDADSRLQKVIRVVIRCLRQIINMLLAKHQRVHLIMADANHDPASEAWLREMFAAFFENEPRITVDRSPGTYYAYHHGLTALFYHHGHKRTVKDVDSVLAGRFREMYGNTKFAYAHLGHRHSDELKSGNLMKVEQHETLAAPDAHEANGGWPMGRSAKVITYSKRFGEVGRHTITPEMVQA